MFDLGNVIICFDHMISAKKISKYSHLSPDEVYNLFFESKITEKFDRGLMTEKDFFEGVKRKLKLNGLGQKKFYNIWNSIFWENKGISELIKEVKRKYQKFFIISNVNKPHFEYIWEKFPVVRLADEIILSYKVGALKPDYKIYKVAIDKAHCLPENIFYTDDRPELVEKALNFGFLAVRFKDINEIRNLIL